jgi:GDP-mannose 4,6-dehydratase
MTKRNKTLITGATGMVGSHLIDYLLANTSDDIYALIRWRSPLDNLRNALSSEMADRLFFLYADIRDAHAIDNELSKHEFEFVYHLAAQSFPLVSFTSPADTLETNVTGTANLLESIRRKSPNSIIHVCSSSEVFGRVPKEFIPIDENAPFHPASPYAISKAGTDLLGRFYSEAYGLNIQITRMFTHTGPRSGDVFAESTFAKQIAMAEFGLKDRTIKVGNLNSLRTIADVRDAVRAYHLLLNYNPVAGSVYNIGGTESMTVGEILEFLINESTLNDFKIEVDPSRLRPIDADLQIPNTKKFMDHTGWSPDIKPKQTLRDLLNYWREEIQLGRPVVDR